MCPAQIPIKYHPKMQAYIDSLKPDRKTYAMQFADHIFQGTARPKCIYMPWEQNVRNRITSYSKIKK
jgi:hypothetical protein